MSLRTRSSRYPKRGRKREPPSAAITGNASRPSDESVPTDTEPNSDVNASDAALAAGWDAGFRAGWELATAPGLTKRRVHRATGGLAESVAGCRERAAPAAL
jgi:hypothetical protein